MYQRSNNNEYRKYFGLRMKMWSVEFCGTIKGDNGKKYIATYRLWKNEGSRIIYFNFHFKKLEKHNIK